MNSVLSHQEADSAASLHCQACILRPYFRILCWCGHVVSQIQNYITLLRIFLPPHMWGRGEQKRRKKIVVDFVNIGKHLFSLASYTHAYLSLSLCFSNFWLHLFLFCSLSLSLSLSDLLF